MLRTSLKYFDWPLFAAVLLLSFTGLIMVYSTGLGGSAVESSLWLKQGLALTFGVLGLFFFAKLDYRFLRKSSSVLYFLAIALLLGVLFFGAEIRGSRRWFDLGLINFQPAEFSKFALLIILAKYFQIKGPMLQKFRYVLWSSLYALIPAGLISLQPDLGSAVIHVALWLGMLSMTLVPKRYFLYLVVMFLIVSALSWQFFLEDYQKDRVRSFLDPTADPLGRGYNVRQAMVAVGAGGVFGSGLARGLQSQLKFLPERQTDFIFASTVEELGVVGGGLVLLLFGFLLWRFIKIQRRARDLFGTYLAAGIFFLVFTQMLINIGMNLALLPVTGVTLPLLSYGGSSLAVICALMGVMENIARNSVPVRFA